jgi:phage shock protein C
MEIKKLYRSRQNRTLAGVCAGIAEYFNVDPTLIRVIWLIMTLVSGVLPGIVAYLICIGIIPVKE